MRSPKNWNSANNMRTPLKCALFFLLSLFPFAAALGQNEPGLVSSDQTGLPSQLWINETAPKMARLIEGTKSADWPYINRLYMMVDLSESEPALLPEQSMLLGASRLNYLWSNGALDAAEALSKLYEWDVPIVRSQVEIIALLSTRPEQYCKGLIAGDYEEIQNGMKIFCLTRADRYEEAIALFEEQTPYLGLERKRLLERFLDLDEDDPLRDEPWIELPNPFEFVLDESIGRPRGLKHLPPAYAYFSRESGVTPRSDLEITEELVHLGSLPAPVLFAAYRENPSAESGGAWGRAEVIQWLDALDKDSTEVEIARVISTGLERFGQIHMSQYFAEEAGEKLSIYNPQNFNNEAFIQNFIRLAVLGDWCKANWRELIARDDPVLMLGFLLRHPEIELSPNQIFVNTPASRIIKPAFFGDTIKPLEASAFGEAIWQSLYVINGFNQHPEYQVSGAFQSLRLSGLDEAARSIAINLLFDEQSP